MVLHGDDDQMVTSGATALLRRRSPTRTCQFHMALQHCCEKVELQDNAPMYVGSSRHLVPKPSDIFACTVHSKILMKLSASNLQTRAATRKYGIISCMSTHGLVDRPSGDGHNSLQFQEKEQSVRPQVEPRGHPHKKSTWPSA